MPPAVSMTQRLDCACANVARWPSSWPALSDAQRALLRRLRWIRGNAFVATMDAHGVARVIVLRRHAGRIGGREWALLPDGRLRGVRAGVPHGLEAA